jgi:hypothetical protein
MVVFEYFMWKVLVIRKVFLLAVQSQKVDRQTTINFLSSSMSCPSVWLAI